MTELVSSAPYGMKAIRHIRGKTGPSERQKKRIKETYEYFLEKVDPIIGDCITHMLCEQPSDILSAMTYYLTNYDANSGREKSITSTNKKARKELKVYLATSIGPVIAKLVNRIAAVQPINVIEFMCEELSSMKDEDCLNPDVIEPASQSIVSAATVPILAPVEPMKGPAKQQQQTTQSKELESKNIQIAIVGLGGSGKSSIINILTGSHEQKLRPTIGFRPFSLMLGDDKVRFYDLGGGKKIRDIWDQYYHDVHGVIYVVDSTADLSHSAPEGQEAIQTFKNTVSHNYLEGKPVLILANKQDSADALPGDKIREAFQLDTHLQLTEYIMAECSSYIPDNVDETYQPDPRIESALEKLLGAIIERYDQIDAKVQQDVQQKAKDEAKKRIERERKVLKNKIASAFVHDLSTAVRETLGVEEDPQNIFNEEEGLAFLAAEIGEEPSQLSDIAVEAARLTGYQRLALQIVGALKAPISKKKVPMEWDAILELIYELRAELEL